MLFWPSPAGPDTFEGADKVVHATLFALLAATARWVGAPLWLVVAYAPVSELVQWLALPNRSGDPWDVVADLTGVLLGWLLARRLLTPTPAVPDPHPRSA